MLEKGQVRLADLTIVMYKLKSARVLSNNVEFFEKEERRNRRSPARKPPS
uniref:Uncharacterized protein n=1 Tax=Picea glauca TaxID=3330 RepID=A0A101LZQ1_PICGL|nr:hypothetical protein ABT39_MTgene5349 [Picea glauca]